MTERRTSVSNESSREEVMASIRRSLAASRPFDAEHQKHHRPASPPVPVQQLGTSADELIENFRSNLTFVGGHLSVVQDDREAAAAVEEIVSSHSAKRIAVSDSELAARIVPVQQGIEIVRNAGREVLFDCDMGITSAQWAIAETGTLVLESDRESHRLTSLVPPVHVCLLRASTIRQTLGEILAIVRTELSPAVTFITGASRTSDIELTLAIGVHGPRELHVVLIKDR